MFGTNLEAAPVLGVDTVAVTRRPPRWRSRPGVRVHAGQGQPRSAEELRGQRHQGGLHHQCRLRRGGRRGPGGPGRAGRTRRRARHPAVRPERPGCRVDAGEPLRADRGALPAGRAHRHRQPERQPGLVVHELRRADRRRREPGGQCRKRRRRRRRRLPRLLRRRPRDPSRLGVRRGRRRRSRVRRASSSRCAAACRS